MSSCKCDDCGCVYVGPVCPRCALGNVCDPHRESDAPDEVCGGPASVNGVEPPTGTHQTGRFEPGDVLGHFRIVRCVGEGGMSRVYEGFDTELERKVAIKVPKVEILQEPEARKWFTQEGQSLARMDDSHVVCVYHSQEFGGVPCHVMEFIEGETLARRIEREERLSPETAVGIGRDIALGLLEIHIHGRIHGDIKPANIIARHRHATIVDFGLSRRLAEFANMPYGGTPRYMAPEVVRGESSGVTEDVYSLGCTMFEALSGEPFRGSASRPDRPDVAESSDLPSVPEVTDIPKSLTDILIKLVAEDPKLRPASAKEVAQLLDGWLRRKRRRRRNTWLLVLVGPLVLACALLAWWAFPRGDIAVLAGDGKVRTLCLTLDKAVSYAQEGDTLELRSDGPFCCESVIVSRKPLTIRPGPGCLPQIELRCCGDRAGALNCFGSLTIQGAIIRCCDDGSHCDSLVYCEGDRLRISNCRFELPLDPTGISCVTAVGTPTLDVQNSVFVGRGGTALAWEPNDKGQLTLLNCLCLGTTALEYRAAGNANQLASIRLEQCSFLGRHVLSVVPSRENRLQSVPDVPSLVEARANVFRTSASLVQFDGWSSDRDPAATMAAHVDWRDQGNLHATDRDRTIGWRLPGAASGAFRTDILSAWTRRWGLTLEDVKAIFVLGGNVESFFGDTRHALVARDLLQRAAEGGKILAGIGDGPAVLADGGFLKGRRAAVQPRFQGLLEDRGAQVAGDGLIQDGNILTAESNFHVRGLVGHLPDKPLVLALIAEKDFWFDDFRAAKYEVERIGGTFLTVSTTIGTAKPDKSGGGSPIVPDFLLPLLRHDGGVKRTMAADSWLSTGLTDLDPFDTPVERFALNKKAASNDGIVPGIDAATLGPGLASQR